MVIWHVQDAVKVCIVKLLSKRPLLKFKSRSNDICRMDIFSSQTMFRQDIILHHVQSQRNRLRSENFTMEFEVKDIWNFPYTHWNQLTKQIWLTCHAYLLGNKPKAENFSWSRKLGIDLGQILRPDKHTINQLILVIIRNKPHPDNYPDDWSKQKMKTTL